MTTRIELLAGWLWCFVLTVFAIEVIRQAAAGELARNVAIVVRWVTP